MANWNLYRDYEKAISTKVYYTKANAAVLNNPSLHAEALYHGVKSEGISPEITEIFAIRMLIM